MLLTLHSGNCVARTSRIAKILRRSDLKQLKTLGFALSCEVAFGSRFHSIHSHQSVKPVLSKGSLFSSREVSFESRLGRV